MNDTRQKEENVHTNSLILVILVNEKEKSAMKMICRLCLDSSTTSESFIKLYNDLDSNTRALEMVKLIEKYLDIEVCCCFSRNMIPFLFPTIRKTIVLLGYGLSICKVEMA